MFCCQWGCCRILAFVKNSQSWKKIGRRTGRRDILHVLCIFSYLFFTVLKLVNTCRSGKMVWGDLVNWYRDLPILFLNHLCALLVLMLKKPLPTCTYKALLNGTSWHVKGEVVGLSYLKEWLGIPAAEGNCFWGKKGGGEEPDQWWVCMGESGRQAGAKKTTSVFFQVSLL